MQHLCPPLSWIILNHDKSKSNDLFISVKGSLVYIYGTMGQEIYYNNRHMTIHYSFYLNSGHFGQEVEIISITLSYQLI